MAEFAAVAASAQVGDDGMERVEEMIEKLKAENLALPGQLVAKKSAHARALLNNARLPRNMQRVMKEKVEAARLVTLEQGKRENSAVMEQLKKDVMTVTMKAGKQIGALTASLEQVLKKVDVLKMEKATLAQNLDERRECKDRAEYDHDGLEAMLQRAERERRKCEVAVNRV